MDLKQLLYFKTVVEEGTISAAAKKLNLSQPPLSQQIKQLESELGVTLMERGARKITLNEAGRVLYPAHTGRTDRAGAPRYSRRPGGHAHPRHYLFFRRYHFVGRAPSFSFPAPTYPVRASRRYHFSSHRFLKCWHHRARYCPHALSFRRI